MQANDGDPVLIRLRNVSKTYHSGAQRCRALRDVSLDVRSGECVAVMGKSGSGKTTLVNVLTGIDTPSAGQVEIAGAPVERLSEAELSPWRGRTVGLVFQFFQLLPTLTVLENVVLPMEFSGALPARRRRQRALDLLARLGIADQADKLPSDLSGGQQQRAALARALANDPPLLVADEPTGNLDSAASDDVLCLLSELAREGKTILVVTHEPEAGHYFDRIITLRDGSIWTDEARPA